MPWQAVPPLLIIGGAFTLTAWGLTLVDRVADGRERRIRIDEMTGFMIRRDESINKRRDDLEKIKAKAAAT